MTLPSKFSKVIFRDSPFHVVRSAGQDSSASSPGGHSRYTQVSVMRSLPSARPVSVPSSGGLTASGPQMFAVDADG